MSADGHVRQQPESSAVCLRGVTWAAVGALLLLAATIGGLHAIYQIAVPVRKPPPPREFVEPRVDTQETEELHRILGAQRRKLETWRWTNEQHTRVQIPIERAMKLLAQEGSKAYAPTLPPQPALASPTAGAQRAVTPDEMPDKAPAAKRPAPPEPSEEKQP